MHCRTLKSQLPWSVLSAGLLIAATQAICTADVPASDAPPNILLVLADDVGSEVLGCYGGESYPTPRLDRLAQEGLRFEHAYTMPVCHPTRVCLLTGQYPFRLGNPRWGTFPEAAAARTLPRLLKDAGYATAIGGKWQLALLGDDPTHPQRLGFDESSLFGWHEGPRYYQPHIRQNGALRGDVRDRYGPDVICDFLVDFIERHPQQPWFAFYSMGLCHAVTNDLEKPVPVGPNGRYQTYAEMVAAMDDRVGRLLDALDALGQRDNTLVIFFTDNGTPARNVDAVRGDQLVYAPVASRRQGQSIPGGKGQLTDAGTRVPLLVRWPGVVEAGRTTDCLVDVSDLLPTLVEVASARLPDEVVLDGKSFASCLRGTGPGAREWVFAEHKGRAFVRDRRFKLDTQGTLWDLASDPAEQQTRSLDGLKGSQAKAVGRLKLALDQLHAAGLPLTPE
jgi:arylsulfatase A